MNTADDKFLQEIWKLFQEQQHVFLATAEGDQPRLRPVTLLHLSDKLYVATGSNDAKVKQLKQNPKVEFCLLLEGPEGKGTLRAECTAKIVQDMRTKAYAYEKIPFMKEFWKNPEDRGYTLIHLEPKGFEYMKPGTMQPVKVRP